jgi:oligopeptide transport system permease protein
VANVHNDIKDQEYKDIDVSKLVLVQQDEVLYDQKIETEPIGYFKDAWIRFRKNRMSLVAFVILVMLFLLSFFAPYFNSYTFDDSDARLANLTPRIPLVENLGIFDGSKWLNDRPTSEFNRTNIPDGMILNVKNHTTKYRCNGQIVDDLCYSGGQQIQYTESTFADYKVDFYIYTNYVNTFGDGKHMTRTKEQFDKIDPDIITGTPRFTETNMVRYTALNSRGNETVYSVTATAFASVDPEIIIGDIEEYKTVLVRFNADYFRYLGYEEGEMPYFWFGSDGTGRDLFTLIWLGARTSFMVAFSVAAINIVLGILLGAICGYYGGNIDLILQRIFEIISGIPFLALITLLILRFGNAPWVIVLAFTLTGWVGISRTVRAQFYRYKGREYVLAARTLGAKDMRIMARHVFPNAAGTIITSTILIIPSVIFTESTFSFLGIISFGTTTSIGRILSEGQAVMQESFHILLFPSIFISLMMLSFNMFGNGLRDAFNPSLRGVE